MRIPDLKIHKKKHLFYLLGTDESTIQKLIQNVKPFYEKIEINKVALSLQDDGTLVEKIKKRTVYSPNKLLKHIQHRILKKMLRKCVFPVQVMGGLPRRDNVQNAKMHQGLKYHLVTDIRNFFPSVSHEKIYGIYLELGCSHDVSHILTPLTTFQGKLPQGAPTSCDLANLFFLPYDLKLIEYCSSNSIVYSRFVDDLAFSSTASLEPHVQNLLEIISSSGLRIHYGKTHVKVGPVDITGATVHNNELRITKSFEAKLRQEEQSDDSRRGRENYKQRVENA